MAIQLNLQRYTPATTEETQAPTERPKAAFYVNVGYYDVIDGEEIFVSLPMGIPVDSMKEVEVRGKNEGYRELCRRKNRLLSIVKGQMLALNPGEDAPVGELLVQFRRASGSEGPDQCLPVGESTLTKLTFGRRA